MTSEGYEGAAERATSADALALIAAGTSYALIRKQESPVVDILVGETRDVASLADIPLRDELRAGPDVLALVPFRQIRERGFVAHDDGAPLSCLVVGRHLQVPVAEFAAACPPSELVLGETSYDLDDDEYAEVVRRVVEDEIGRGEGANFVVRRSLRAQVADWSPAHALGVFRNLLLHETGAYWTFLAQTPERTLIGASPERHISSRAGMVAMNPISGTFRMPAEDVSPAELRARLEGFLRDEKEILELMMVVDEELKMMAALCPEGGRVMGPFLKAMSHLAHTEYVLEGQSSLEPRELLRGSMFAATVVGSPVENACRVVHRYEGTGRGYYGAVIAEIGHGPDGLTLDAPIVIRTADIDRNGALQVSVGATLVRDSVPVEEVAETKAKVAGLLSALGVGRRRSAGGGPGIADLMPVDAPELRARNARLSPFWLTKVAGPTTRPDLAGLTVDLVSAEDDFANMLAHLLRAIGMRVRQTAWRDLPPSWVPDADLLLVGPGPGDPRSTDSPRMAVLRRLVADRLSAARPLLAVCLGHQLLAAELGLPLRPKRQVVQGAQEAVDLFGRHEIVGFYNTFTAVLPEDGAALPVECATQDDEVVALRGPGYAGLQFHAESVLTPNGVEILAEAVRSALQPVPAREPAPAHSAAERTSTS